MNQYSGIYRRCELLYIRHALEQFGLQPLEGKILIYLEDHQCTQEDIGSHFDLDKGRIARCLSELEERDLVCRHVNEQNKRQKFVTVTDQGRHVLADIHKVFAQWDQLCYTGFTEEEKKLYQDFVRRIAENVMNCRHREGDENDGK